MAKLGVNIVGGPNPSDIKVTNAETGDEIKGITGGTINMSLDGITATITVLVNHLDVKIDKTTVQEVDSGPGWKHYSIDVKLSPQDKTDSIKQVFIPYYNNEVNDDWFNKKDCHKSNEEYNPGDSWV